MATVNMSEVRAGIGGISQKVAGAREMQKRAKAMLLAARAQIAAIPAEFRDVIETVQGYQITSRSPFETVCKDEIGLLVSEYQALASELDAEITALGA